MPAAQPFHSRLLGTAASYLAGDAGALERFVRREFLDLAGPRDRAAAALALHQAVHTWLPGTAAADAEGKVRLAVRQAVTRAASLEQHWQRRLLVSYLPGDRGEDALRQVESRLDVARAIRDAAVPGNEQALLRDLADSVDGWAAVRRHLPPDLTADDQAFFRWQRAARQRWQRRLRSPRPG